MNKKIGIYSSIINVIAVFSFAICMLIGSDFGSYFSSMFIAFSFIPMVCAYAYFSKDKSRVAAFAAALFAAVYVTLILLVYFAQLTVVRVGGLTEQAMSLLDFQKSGLFFNYDLLGYGLMALSTFFVGLTIEPKSKPDKWLKYLLIIHGVFFISCLIMPMLGIFTPDSPKWIGIAVLEFWCAYFIPIGILSFLHFSKSKD